MRVKLSFSGHSFVHLEYGCFSRMSECIGFIVDKVKEFPYIEVTECVYGNVDCSSFRVEDFDTDHPVVVF